MELSIRGKPYLIPEYSLTGDLLAYKNCGLQYRYHNKGDLPPSKPVQLWFGEFIHGVMEESYRVWNAGKKDFPWDWESEIRDIELTIERRLRAKGLYAPSNNFCRYPPEEKSRGLCPDDNHPHKLISSQRAEAAINVWGQDLFPLIDEAEIKLSGIQDMPENEENRAKYFGITGIADVISSVNLLKDSDNTILKYVNDNEESKKIIKEIDSSQFEIIIDYKGMRRPPKFIKNGDEYILNPTWLYHAWQILTYAWLREQQPDSRKIVAGIIFYLNELVPSKEDLRELQEDVKHELSDIKPLKDDKEFILSWNKSIKLSLSKEYKMDRSIRLIPINEDKIGESLIRFSEIVGEIENSISMERAGTGIMDAWSTNPTKRTCTACDFKTFCPNPAPKKYKVIAP